MKRVLVTVEDGVALAHHDPDIEVFIVDLDGLQVGEEVDLPDNWDEVWAKEYPMQYAAINEMIAEAKISNQPTVLTLVNSHFESLADFCSTQASLGCAARVNLHQQPTSLFRFVGQHVYERCPSGIVDRPFERAMKVNLHLPHFRQPQLVPGECLSNFFKGHAVVTPKGFESRVARVLSRLNTSKERLQRPIDTLKCILQDSRTNRGDVWANLANLRDLQNLIKETYRLTLQFPGITSLLKRSVIQLAAHSKVIIKRLLLTLGGIDPIAKSLNHVGPILSNRFSDARGK